MRLRIAVLTLALLAAVAGTLPAAASSSSDQVQNPGRYYLSLGNSLAFGFQQARFNALFPNENPAAFDTGYANDLAAIVSERASDVALVNYGCPGETTVSFMNGPCPYPFPLHNAFSQSSQLATAVAFLQAHPNQVSPITIDIGSNDTTQALVPVCLDPSQAAACAAALNVLLPKLGANLATIIGTLHAASPGSEIIVLDLYNPLAVQFPASDQLAAVINNTIKTVAAAQGARVADVFAIFNPGGAAEVPTLCRLTAICTALQDTHPTDLGYAAMALTIWQASGLATADN